MRTMKTILSLVFAGFTATSVLASGNLRVNVLPVNDDLVEVNISNVKMSTFEIDVKNENGDVVFYKETKAPSRSYKRNYDFTRLEDGTYFLTVKVDNELTETKFNIERGKLNVLDVNKSMEPVFIFKNKELKLTYLNFEGEKTKVLVYGNNRDLYYEKELAQDFSQHLGLDFSKASRGSYEVVLTNGFNVYSYNVFVD